MIAKNQDLVRRMMLLHPLTLLGHMCFGHLPRDCLENYATAAIPTCS